MLILPDRLTWYVPLAKAGQTTERGVPQRFVYGVASTDDWDLQEQRILQEGIDFDPLLRSGFLNWNHQDRPGALIGEPWQVEIAPFQGRPALHLMGILYQGVADAEDAWNLLKALADKRNASHRELGWSVQGSVNQIQADTVLQCMVSQMALTHEPVNPYTFARFAKSWKIARSQGNAMTTATAAPLRMQDLDSGVSSVLYGPCQAHHYDAQGHFRRGIGDAFRHLVICRGYTPDQAHALLRHEAHRFEGKEVS